MQAFQIGHWLVEPGINEIRRGDHRVKLEPKAMDVLMAFIASPSQVISRDELLQRAWPGVVVGDDSVTQAIIKLRKAFGDSRHSPQYIETIPKVGYRLVARVVDLGDEGPAAPDPAGLPRSTVAQPAVTSAPGMNDGPTVWDSTVTDSMVNLRPVTSKPATKLLLIIALAGLASAALVLWWSDAPSKPAQTPGLLASTGEPLAGLRAENFALTPSIAVMQFVGLGNHENVRLLSAGISEDLRTDLSKVRGLLVTVDSDAISAEQVGGKKRARYLVSGSVQLAGNSVRINARLVDSDSGLQIWSEQFDRPTIDFFEIQKNLTQHILSVLPARLDKAELERVARRDTHKINAYKVFRLGQSALLVRSQSENEVARKQFRRALELDPSYARAYAGLALTYAADYRNHWSSAPRESLQRMDELARTAHQINPDSWEVHWVLAFVNLERGHHDHALRFLQTAIELYPSYADGYALMGGINTYLGRPQRSVELLRIAMRLNPHGGYLYYLLLGRAYFFLGDLEQATINLSEALKRNPTNLEARVYMAAVHVKSGNVDEAAWQAEEIRSLSPQFTGAAWLSTYPMTDPNSKDVLGRVFGTLGLGE